jgi:hypothetical protein
MLHVSLWAVIIQFCGPGSVPFVVAVTVFGVFELGGRLASQRAKDALSKWLLTFDIQKARALPDGTKEFFERIFGKRHFSLKCFVLSAVFSLGAMGFISIVCLLINPHPSEVFSLSLGGMEDPNIPEFFRFWTLAFWFPWSIVIDYISLFKTRLILELLGRLHRSTSIVAIAILVLDYIIYRFIFFVSGLLTGLVVSAVFLAIQHASITDIWERIRITVLEHVEYFDFFLFLLDSPLSLPLDLNFILVWSGFAPSIWMWLYVLALFVTRLLLRSERIVNWLRWALDIEKNPFRSIGAVAATLAFIASVAVILVSAEISNISSALEGPTDQQPQQQEAPQ